MIRDVVIIGSGAGGAPLAYSLSKAGLDVLVLEKGPRYSRADYRHDEVAMNASGGFFVPRIDEDPHVLVAPGAQPTLTTLGWIACCVGGGTAHMGASLYRFHPDDFRVRTRFGEFEATADWPYSYDEIEPFYAIAEREVGVSGGVHTGLHAGWRSTPYPMPPLQCHPIASAIDSGCAQLGVCSFDTPRGINSRVFGDRPACSLCDLCAGFGCPSGARGSTQETLLPRAQATGRCEVRARAMVREITLGPLGRVDGCVYIDEAGAEHKVQARLVCVCCSAVESARLLLMSRSSRYPEGLANSSGLVGRNLQFHIGSAARAFFRDDRHPKAWSADRNPFIGRSVMDYYTLPRGISPFAKGGLFRFDFERRPPINAAQWVAHSPTGTIWGQALKQHLREHFTNQRSVELEVFQDFVPNDGTFMNLDPRVRDRWGLPVARIHLATVEHHRVAGEWLVQRGREILDAAGADSSMSRDIGYVSSVMTHGTCRAGHDPSRSVLDWFCRTHDVPNLFVVDGSFMPTSGGAPTTLTILANSFRTANHILQQRSSGVL